MIQFDAASIFDGQKSVNEYIHRASKFHLRTERESRPIRVLQDCFVSEHDEIPEDDYRLYYVDKYDEEFIRPILGEGEIGAIKGASGVFKTTYLDTLVAGCYTDRIIAHGGNVWNATSGYRMKLEDTKEPWAIIHADTEQRKSLFNRRRRQLYKRISGSYKGRPKNYCPLYFKGIPMQTKIDYIEQLVTAFDAKGVKVKFLFLDHPRDFLDNPNDITEAIQFVEWIEQLQEHYGFTMPYAFHCNSTSSKMDGHIGSQLNKKNVMEAYLQESKQEAGIINVSFEKLRDAPRDFKIDFARVGDNLHIFDPEIISFGVNSRVSQSSDSERVTNDEFDEFDV